MYSTIKNINSLISVIILASWAARTLASSGINRAAVVVLGGLEDGGLETFYMFLDRVKAFYSQI